MSDLDRHRVIELLERLGAEDDAEALAAARALHGYVSQAGIEWDDLLEPELDEEGEEAFEPDEEALEDDEDVDLDEDEDEEGEAPLPQVEEEPLVSGELEEDAKLIDRLLARKGLSAETRSELAGLKEDMQADEFTAMDSRYVRALAKRLGA